MSTAIAKNFQVGSDSTATNNFTIRQPATPDGTVRIANGNSGTTTDLVTVTSAGNVGVGTTSPAVRLEVRNDTSNAARLRVTSSATTAGQYRGYEFGNGSVFKGGLLQDQSTDMISIFTPIGGQSLNLTTEGNLGLGVTPSAWATITPMQIKNASYSGYANEAIMSANTYYNAGWKYIATDGASRYSQGSGAHYWFTAPSGTAGNTISFTQAMTLTAGGDLGVGTTSPAWKLDVNGIVASRSDSLSGMRFQTSANGYNGFVLYETSSNSIIVNNYNAGPITFKTSDTERARITTGGDFVIGKTAASESYTTGNGYGFAAATTDPFFSIVNVNGSGANGCIYLNRRNVGSASLLIAFLSNNGSSQASVGSITHNGSNTAYNTASDYRLKYDIAPMTGALAKVALLKPCTYKWNVSGADGEGFIAHELAEVCPQAVTGEKDAVNKDGSINPQGIDTSYLVATLTAAIQELKAELDSVKTELALLKGTA